MNHILNSELPFIEECGATHTDKGEGKTVNRSLFIGILAGLVLTLTAGAALADQCMNASKQDQSAGAQLVLGPEGEFLWATEGLMRRIENGVIDGETGEGFHGIIGFDSDGDGVVDISIWTGVGPDGHEVPIEAQLAGPACRGLTNIGVYYTQCLGG